MRPDQDSTRLTGRRSRVSAPLPGWLAGLAAVTVGGVLLVIGLLFSVLVIAVGLGVGLVGYGVLRWKLRGWRKRLREAEQQARAGRGEIIDVQARVIDSRPHRSDEHV